MDLREAALTDFVVSTRHPWERARIEVVRSLLREQAPRLFRERATVLDVGCGDTFLVENLAAEMPATTFLAVDPMFTQDVLDAYAHRHAERATRIHVFRTLEEAAASSSEPIDCVLLLDVIEHVEDDIGLLRTLCAHPGVHRDTLFLITVPAFQSLFSAHDVFLGHYRRYDSAMLADHARRGGLAAVTCGYFFGGLLLPRLFILMFEKATGRSSAKGIGDWRGSALLGSLMKHALLADFRITHTLRRLGISVPGLSTYALCRTSA